MYYLDFLNKEKVDDIGEICEKEFSMLEYPETNDNVRHWISEKPEDKLCVVKYIPQDQLGSILAIQLWPNYTYKDEKIKSFLIRARSLSGSTDIYQDYKRRLTPIQID